MPTHVCSFSAWQDVADGVLSGINHAISNRLANLSAHVELLRLGDVEATDAPGGIAAEGERLEELLRLSRLLPRERHTTAEPIAIPELLPDILALFHLHRDVEGIECDVEGDLTTLPVRVERSTLVRTILVMLVAVGSRVASSHRITLRYFGDGVYSSVAVQGETAKEGFADPLAMRPLIEEAGGTIAESLDGPTAGYELRLPTLAESRRRSRKG
jgi:hypothetical protein